MHAHPHRGKRACGLALLGIGAGKIAVMAGGGGAVTLVIAGAVLLVSPFLLDRVERISVSATSVDMWLYTQVTDQGAPQAAQILQRTDLGSFAESYALIHGELLGRPQYKEARVYLQDLLVDRAASIAQREKFEAREVRALFASGSPVIRVLTLGLMQGDTSLAHLAVITAAVTDGRSRNEQYQGLRLAKLCWPRLSDTEKEKVHTAIRQAGIAESARWPLAQEVLNLPTSSPTAALGLGQVLWRAPCKVRGWAIRLLRSLGRLCLRTGVHAAAGSGPAIAGPGHRRCVVDEPTTS